MWRAWFAWCRAGLGSDVGAHARLPPAMRALASTGGCGMPRPHGCRQAPVGPVALHAKGFPGLQTTNAPFSRFLTFLEVRVILMRCSWAASPASSPGLSTGLVAICNCVAMCGRAVARGAPLDAAAAQQAGTLPL